MEPIETIDTQALSTVHGGFGAILGALLQAAPGIISSVSGLVSASKGGGGAQTASAQAQPTAGAPTSLPPSAAMGPTAAPTQMASGPSGPAASACRCCCDPVGAASVQNMVRIG
jgi:hypothetical protein